MNAQTDDVWLGRVMAVVAGLLAALFVTGRLAAQGVA